MSTQQTRGIHHITAISANPVANVDFYVRFLGLRLVKKTVNFDDPKSYHLYFGDTLGRPGTIMTFFLWPGAPRGQVGLGQVSTVAFAIPQGATAYWQERATKAGQYFESLDRFGDSGLALRDPDGISIELIEDGPPVEGRGEVPIEAAISGFHSAALSISDKRPTEALLTSLMGYTPLFEEEGRIRFQAQETPGRYLDLVSTPGVSGRMGAGTVHHIAFRARDDADQVEWQNLLRVHGYKVTQVLDRNYFHSIYFSEPGGVLFEIATDPPGFAADEPQVSLGESLRLPEWLEPRRAEIERSLPSLV
jgi:glyoxalase family protein